MNVTRILLRQSKAHTNLEHIITNEDELNIEIHYHFIKILSKFSNIKIIMPSITHPKLHIQLYLS